MSTKKVKEDVTPDASVTAMAEAMHKVIAEVKADTKYMSLERAVAKAALDYESKAGRKTIEDHRKLTTYIQARAKLSKDKAETYHLYYCLLVGLDADKTPKAVSEKALGGARAALASAGLEFGWTEDWQPVFRVKADTKEKPETPPETGSKGSEGTSPSHPLDQVEASETGLKMLLVKATSILKDNPKAVTVAVAKALRELVDTANEVGSAKVAAK